MHVTGFYWTIKNTVQIKNTIKKSRFISSVQEIEDEQGTRIFLKTISQQFPDASHHCWAYQYGIGHDVTSQYSDGGEPANSAGPPILQAIKKEEINNVMVIVTRYFGGIKLGISGLIRAYRDSALKGLREAGKIKKIPLRSYIIENVNYPVLGNILQSIESQSGIIENIEYGEKVRIEMFLPDRLQDWVMQMVKNVSKGEASICINEIKWYHKK